jgi:antitoxin ChpS
MHTTSLRKVGGSVMLAVPPAILEILHLKAGAKVGLTVEQGRLLVEASRRPQYALENLLAQCDPAAEVSLEDHAWLDDKPTGNELL